MRPNVSRFFAAALALALAAVPASCTPDDDELVEVGTGTAELTYDTDGNAYLSQFELLARERLVMRAEDHDTFHGILARVYGDYRVDTAEAIRLQILDRDFSWAPDIQLVDSSVLAGNAGAYSAETGMVYMADDVPDALPRTMIYLEEIGHHLDMLLVDEDTPGDEGGLFRLLMVGAPVSAADEAALRAENDHTTIYYRGQILEVELFFLWDWLEDAWEAVVDAWDWVSDRVFWAVVDQFVIALDVAKTLGNSAIDGVSALSSGLAKLAEGDISGGLKDLFSGAMELSLIPAASLVMTIVLHEIQALQHLIFGGGRPLTAAEKANARQVFGDRYWIDWVRVVEGKTEAGVFMLNDRPFTLEFTIYLKGWDATEELLVHECAHVFQFANGDGTYKLMSVYDQLTEDNAYDWRGPANDGALFLGLGVEQQAKFVEDGFVAGCFELQPYQNCYIDSVNRTTLFRSAMRAIRSGIWNKNYFPPALTAAIVL